MVIRSRTKAPHGGWLCAEYRIIVSAEPFGPSDETVTDRPATQPTEEEIEITPEMIAVGESIILGVVGGADLGALFSASDLAKEVFLAMLDCSRSKLAKRCT
jgi:hypothetical protein